MIEINKTAIGIAAGLAGTLFIGYCIYFDKKRRSEPDYKKKSSRTWEFAQLKIYNNFEKGIYLGRRRNRKTGSSKQGMPNLNDHEAIER